MAYNDWVRGDTKRMIGYRLSSSDCNTITGNRNWKFLGLRIQIWLTRNDNGATMITSRAASQDCGCIWATGTTAGTPVTSGRWWARTATQLTRRLQDEAGDAMRPFNREKFLLWMLDRFADLALQGLFTYRTVMCANVQAPKTVQEACPDLADNYSKFVQVTLGALLGLLAGSSIASSRQPSSEGDRDASALSPRPQLPQGQVQQQQRVRGRIRNAAEICHAAIHFKPPIAYQQSV